MPLEINIQLSLFGKTSWERFLLATGWILEPCYPRSQAPRFQCLLLETGQTPEWCEGDGLTSWQILEGGVLPRYCLSPGQCAHFLHLAERAGCPPPKEIEALLLKQGGVYQSSTPFNCTECEALPRKEIERSSRGVLEGQLTLFPHF